MQKIVKVVLALALGFVLSSGAQAQQTSTSQNQNSSGAQSSAANQGVTLENTWNTPSGTDVHEHISGVTGSNEPVGLGSFYSSNSPDYCGGTQQFGFSAPYVTAAAGGPTMKEPGYACDDHRTAVHAMEFAATFGNAAMKALQLADEAQKVGNAAEVTELKAASELYSKMSMQQANFAVLMECGHSESARRNSRLAGINCPETDAEKSAESTTSAAEVQVAAAKRGEPTDPFIRSREGLPPLAVAAK